MKKEQVIDALRQSVRKLDPRTQVRNPVMLVVYIGALLTTVLWVLALCGVSDGAAKAYTLAIALILWFTVLFANFAESIAESRGRAQADSLRGARKDVEAKKLASPADHDTYTMVVSNDLKKGDIVFVGTGDQIPMDGEVIEGAASVDESAITGESAPVIRESGGDRSGVTGGTMVVSDWLVIRVTAEAGESFLDKMISMVEGAARRKTPNEIALQTLLVTLTIIFLVVSAVLLPYTSFVARQVGSGGAISLTTVIALLVCLAPTTIGALLSSIGIAGMSRLNQANVLAMSGRAIEAAGDVDVLLLDKTGTITLGNRQAAEFLPVNGVSEEELADAAQLSSLADETAEGRSVVILAKEKFGIRGRDLGKLGASFIEFSATTRMSGIDYDEGEIRKGAADAIKNYVLAGGGGGLTGSSAVSLPGLSSGSGGSLDAGMSVRGTKVSAGAVGVSVGGDMVAAGRSGPPVGGSVPVGAASYPPECDELVRKVAGLGGTPLVVAKNHRALGVIYLKDIVKNGVKERFDDLRHMGIKTIMITGDNPMTAAAIAAEAGVDDFLAEATPEAKLELIRSYQRDGHLVAMTGDGTNDAPALAQADVAVAMNSGTQAAKEAGNMVDLDSSPTKLIDIVRIGKQLLMTRGALTTFSVANDVAKYFAVIPVLFFTIFPGLAVLNFMHLTSTTTAILSAIVYNALIIVALIPLALRGVKYRELPAGQLLGHNLLVYGLGGLVAPFVALKLIDMILTLCGVA